MSHDLAAFVAPNALSTSWNTGSSPSVQELGELAQELSARREGVRNVIRLVDRNQAALAKARQAKAADPPPHVSVTNAAGPSTASQPVASSSKQRKRSASPLPTTNGNSRVSSSELSDNDSAQPIRKPKKKRKHDVLVIGSDEDYSEQEPPAEPPVKASRKLDRADPQQSSILETLPLPGHARPALERKDSATGAPSGQKAPDTAASPAAQSPAGTPTGIQSLKLKLSNPPKRYDAPLRKGPLPPGTAEDFAMPARQLIPPKPITAPPPPLPKRQEDVTGDFDIPKPNVQTPYSTFITSVEPYLRSFGDDDLAFLSVKSEDIQPFLIPALGRYYAETWGDEDAGYHASPSRNHGQHSALEPPAVQRVKPSDLNDDGLATEHVQLGPLSERLVASLGEDGLTELATNLPDELDASVGTAAPMDAVDLEDRLKRELRFLGVFPTETTLAPLSASLNSPALTGAGEVDWSARTDDEISTALRACQRALRDQIAVNEARKAKLATLVRDRLAYQEYESTRDGLEKVIETGWIKRQRHGKPKKPKPGQKDGAPSSSSSSQPAVVDPKAPIEPKPPMPQELLHQLDRRARYVDAFAQLFSHSEEGKWRGIPERSVYEDDELTRVEHTVQ